MSRPVCDGLPVDGELVSEDDPPQTNGLGGLTLVLGVERLATPLVGRLQGVIRAARIGPAAHGGQILVWQTTRAAIAWLIRILFFWRPEDDRLESITMEPRAAERPDGPLVSVIVPVRDDPAGITQLLERLSAQTLDPGRFEVVIGDDGSRLESGPPAASMDGRVKIVRGPRQTSYAARNRAIGESRGRVLAFCDSDCIPEPTWLEQGLAALEDADIVAGEVRFSAPPRPSVWSLLTMDMFLDQERNVLLSRAVTANLFVRRTLFDEVGGFDDSLPSGGDYDFVRRCVERGVRLAYAPRAVVLHPTLDRARPFLRKVWTTNKWSGARRARRGARGALRGSLTFVPVLGVARARRHALRPVWGLHRTRLEASGVRPSLRDNLRVLPVLYFVVAYVAGFARARGWLIGRRLARVATTRRS